MTNFKPIKDKIWEAAQKNNEVDFNKQCDALMKKAVDDWWRIGWNICPKSAEEVVNMIEYLAKSSHEAWVKAMKCGDAPPEDVSPGEGFAIAARLVKDAISKKESNDSKGA